MKSYLENLELFRQVSDTPTFHAELREGGWLHTHFIHPPERSPCSYELSRRFSY
jgi:hypothetical protein